MKILTVSPRGFCAGVRRAIEIVDLALKKFGAPIYVRKEIVHNQAVVNDFQKRGVIFIDELNEAPDGALIIFSAHGISPMVREEAKRKNFKTIDATCPLVTKVHFEVHRFVKAGYLIILIGHKDHDEVVGTMGEAPGKIYLVETVDDVSNLPLDPQTKIMVLTQTTLSVDETKSTLTAIKNKFPKAETPANDDICYATQNRQDAVKELVDKHQIDLLLVVGSQNSSNSRRLCEVARERGLKAYLVDQAEEIKPEWLQGVSTIGVTAGASAPEHLVEGVVNFFKQKYKAEVEEVFVRAENVNFSLPKELSLTGQMVSPAK
ncbi:MAG: 4-hydroxy-3-methylbut-2-enyl diphosphate reductase [Elusimicrobia bacterium]|nr:4-hydroxy-3-methylbut-2-enyl diphosphate reductase [Candidatus Obscuribacterium magneticum]